MVPRNSVSVSNSTQGMNPDSEPHKVFEAQQCQFNLIYGNDKQRDHALSISYLRRHRYILLPIIMIIIEIYIAQIPYNYMTICASHEIK